METVADGSAGRAVYRGIGVARGYWGRADLTAEKFVPDLFAGKEGARFYRTGDQGEVIGGWEHGVSGTDGSSGEDTGVSDRTGEVEAVLSGCAGVQKAMVMVREDVPGEKRLVGYVAAPGGVLEARELREYVKQRLPEYMVPTAWVVMEGVAGAGEWED